MFNDDKEANNQINSLMMEPIFGKELPNEPSAPIDFVHSEVTHASMIKRFFALVVDSTLLIYILSIFSIDTFFNEYLGLAYGMTLTFIIFALYMVIMDYFFNGSIGKMAMGIKINFENQDNKSKFQDSLTRETYGRAFSVLPLFLGHIWAFKNPQSQSWHDIAAKSQVIEK